jgi:hypothetical protein
MMAAMTSTVEPVAIPEEEAREAINRWSRGFFRVRYLGDKIFLDKIAPCFSYTVRLRSQYEERTVSPVSVPYHGSPLDNRGTSPDAWDVAVRRPVDFEERVETLAVPHTDRVTLCPKCAGVGRVDCSQCQASGKVTCPYCGGRGYRESGPSPHESGAANKPFNPSPQTLPARRDCPHCAHGYVSCPACSGNGRKTCSTCEGSGNVRTFDQLTVRFHTVTPHKVLDATDVPDELIRKLPGESVFDRRAERLESCPGMPAAVEDCGQALLRESHTFGERQTRLLFQDLNIQRVPVHEVDYHYAGVPRRLWIYGNGQVYAPGAPWRRDRLWAILAAIAAAIVVIVLLTLLLRG